MQRGPQFFEAIDLIVGCIKNRFNQPGFEVYSKLEKMLLNAANKCSIDSEFDETVTLYGSDFNPPVLKTQLQILSTKFDKPVSFSAVKEFLVDLGEARSVLSEVVKLVELILVMPATNATSERSFSALKRVKTYLRASMKQQRLNNLMLLHAHKELTDKLDLVACANDFVSANEHRLQVFQ